MAKKSIEVDPVVVERKVEMDRILDLVKEVDYNLAELEATYKKQLEDLKGRYEKRRMTMNETKLFYQGQLRGLFEHVPKSETKTQSKVALLNGDVIVKKPSTTFDYDKTNLLEWAESNKLEQFIDIKEVKEFRWADFKKQLVITEQGIVNTETGEVMDIEGLGIKHTDEELVIKY